MCFQKFHRSVSGPEMKMVQNFGRWLHRRFGPVNNLRGHANYGFKTLEILSHLDPLGPLCATVGLLPVVVGWLWRDLIFRAEVKPTKPHKTALGWGLFIQKGVNHMCRCPISQCPPFWGSMDGKSWDSVRTDSITSCTKNRVSEHEGWSGNTKYLKIIMKDRLEWRKVKSEDIYIYILYLYTVYIIVYVYFVFCNLLLFFEFFWSDRTDRKSHFVSRS